jgi:hypothetical protein
VETRAPSREDRIASLRERDGDFCMHPDCGEPLDFSIDYDDEQNRWAVTLDHWNPLSNGGTWDLDNLKLMHRKCNQFKGDSVPYADGTLPQRRESTFKRRAEKRAGREEICQKCISGRLLLFGEVCDVCGSGPQPAVFPQAYKVQPRDCAHSGMQWCWACTGIGLYEREPASKTVFDGDFLDEG